METGDRDGDTGGVGQGRRLGGGALGRGTLELECVEASSIVGPCQTWWALQQKQLKEVLYPVQ